MPEHLRALIVVLFLASIVFKFAGWPARELIKLPDYTRRRNLWLGLTVVAFISHSFWVYVLVASVVLTIASQREANRLSLYFLLLFLAPPASVEIPGFGLINYLFELNHVRLLTLCLLLPAYLSLKSRPGVVAFGRLLPDKLIAAYLLLVVVMSFRDTEITSVMRLAFSLTIDIFLPYYVASRALSNVQIYRDSLFSFVLAAMVLGLIGTFEYWRHWLLYSSLLTAMEVQWDYLGYLGRAGSLRAMATTGHSIALGFVMAIAIGFYLFLQRDITHINAKRIMGLLLVLGLFSALSRGPWVGAIAILVIYTTMAASAIRKLLLMALVGMVAALALSILPGGQHIVDLLPWIGKTDVGSIDYRTQLVDNAWIVIQQNPWLGSTDFLNTPEMEAMRQGQGIIDLVNTYISLALKYGIVGLGLFLGFFASILLSILKCMKRTDRNGDVYRLGQSLFATLAGVLIIITTVSSITIIPAVYWCVAGLGVGYVQMVRAQETRSVSA